MQSNDIRTNMSSIDDLFKKPSATSNGTKRKLEPPPRNPDEARKAAKTSVNGDAKGKQHATLQDEEPEPDEDDDVEAGPELPPDDDEEEPAPADEEGGRFFGGGTNKHTNDVLDYMDSRGDDTAAPEKFDNAWLRRTVLNFERKINKNTELRSKFADDPMKFIESEGDLDADIQALSVLSEHPALYPEFVKTGSANSLAQLLLHENTDIAIRAIQIMVELTDEDVAATESQWDALAGALIEADIVDLLLSIVKSLDEDKDEDRAGVYHSMELLENLCNNAAILQRILTNDSKNELLKWLLDRVKKQEALVSQNRQYAAELLSIITTQAPVNETSASFEQSAHGRLLALDIIDTLLQLLAPYRKHDPQKDTDDEQFVADIFNTLSTLVEDSEPAKRSFIRWEGVELSCIMLRDGGKVVKSHAMRLLDHALSGSTIVCSDICTAFISFAGLKPLFKLFAATDGLRGREDTECILSIIASLLRNTPGGSEHRIRLLAKFGEKNKQNKLVQLRAEYRKRLAPIEDRIAGERTAIADPAQREAKEVDWTMQRLDAGLYVLQTISVILAWVIAEDGGAARQIKTLMDGSDDKFANLKTTLQEYRASIGTQTEDEKYNRDMLETLISFL